MTIKYRPEIDGLRAISIIAILIYHMEFKLLNERILSGGFLGVDIFFVISGYLITSILLKELNLKNKIEWTQFYLRRVRRLLPLLVVVCLAFLPMAWMNLLPTQFIDFSLSQLYALGFQANYFWYNSLQQYGAESASLKAFLHAWSLGVEEQFYILYPIILAIFFRFKKKWIAFFLLYFIVASFLMTLLREEQNLNYNFYMLQSRIWELLIGGFIAGLPSFKESRFFRSLQRVLPTFGLLLIFYSLIYFNSKTSHPGLPTLIPTLGCAMIILFIRQEGILFKFLSCRYLVGIGLISYSLYLWHYPIIVFSRLLHQWNSWQWKMLILLLIFSISMLTFYAVEKPFRNLKLISNKVLLQSVFISYLFLFIFNYAIVSFHGVPQRFHAKYAENLEEMEKHRLNYWITPTNFMALSDFSKDQKSIAVIGDSWALDIAHALNISKRFQVYFSGMTGHLCRVITLPIVDKNQKNYDATKKSCLTNNRFFQQDFSKTKLILIADSASFLDTRDGVAKNEILKNIQLIRETGFTGPILLIANRPTWKKMPFLMLQEYGSVGDGFNLFVQTYLIKNQQQMMMQDELAKSVYEKNHIYYYSLVDSFCNKNLCNIIHDKKLLYFDWSHLTMDGAKFMSSSLSNHVEKLIDESY